MSQKALVELISSLVRVPFCHFSLTIKKLYNLLVSHPALIAINESSDESQSFNDPFPCTFHCSFCIKKGYCSID